MTVTVDVVNIDGEIVHINIDGKTWFSGDINEIGPKMLIDFASRINEKAETNYVRINTMLDV